MFNPSCKTYWSFQVPSTKLHFCTPAVAKVAASATLPFTARRHERAIAFVADVQSMVVRKPQPEGKRHRVPRGSIESSPAGKRRRKARQDGDRCRHQVRVEPVGKTPAVPT